jgi:hypothetical protein
MSIDKVNALSPDASMGERLGLVEWVRVSKVGVLNFLHMKRWAWALVYRFCRDQHTMH